MPPFEVAVLFIISIHALSSSLFVSISSVKVPTKGTVKRATKKHATCLATLLQNELNSDVARFTTHIKPVLQQIRLLTGLNVGW